MNGMQRGGPGERSWAVEQLVPQLRIGSSRAEKGSLEPLISCTTRTADKTEMTAAVYNYMPSTERAAYTGCLQMQSLNKQSHHVQ